MKRRVIWATIAVVAAVLTGVLISSLLHIFQYEAGSEAIKQQQAELAELSTIAELRKRNPDTVAILNVEGTEIDYPVVQTVDNEFYLNHDFDRKYNDAGWVFADFRNTFDPVKANTIIYGHGRLDGTMFGTLSQVQSKEWSAEDNVITLETEGEVSVWRVFSTYTIPVTDDYLNVAFNTQQERDEFVQMLTERSKRDFEVQVAADAPLLTLSTCGLDEVSRVVVHAVQVSLEKTPTAPN